MKFSLFFNILEIYTLSSELKLIVIMYIITQVCTSIHGTMRLKYIKLLVNMLPHNSAYHLSILEDR